MIKRLPFSPLPINFAKRLSFIFKYPAFTAAKFMPHLKNELSQAEINLTPKEYISIAMVSAFFTAIIIFILTFFLGTFTAPVNTAAATGLVMGITIYFAVYFYAMFYPHVLIQKKVKFLERDLLFALKYILIKIKSGIPLYDAMVGIAQGGYGEVSNEFKKTIREISTGTEEVVALEHMALRAPSTFFRRTIWQITNNLRAGSNISNILESITSTLVREQKILIRKYGSELNPIILMYMMFSIIIPSLGVTVLIVMSSFSGLTVPIYVFYMIPVAVFIAQIFFMRIIKDKKPMLSMSGG